MPAGRQGSQVCIFRVKLYKQVQFFMNWRIFEY